MSRTPNLLTFQFTKEMTLKHCWDIFSQVGPFVCPFMTLRGKYEGNFHVEISSVNLWGKQGEIST